MAAQRQTRRPTAKGDRISGAGMGVDVFGGPAIDPTENVLALVDAESRRQDGLREAETRRLNELAALRSDYESRLDNMRRTQLESTSALLSTQLDRVTNSLTERISKLEQFRWESGGRGLGMNAVLGVLGTVAGLAIALAVAIFK